jgi:hypothetical protein
MEEHCYLNLTISCETAQAWGLVKYCTTVSKSREKIFPDSDE